jgi:hypothetical protein
MKIEPELFYNSYEKISINMSHLSKWRPNSHQDTKRGDFYKLKNTKFKEIIHYLIVNLPLDGIEEFYEK